MTVLSEFAPAKINLHLHVVGRRDDGYHLLDSLVVFAAVGDWLSVAPAASLSLALTGPFAGALQADDDNLVLRAARALAEQADIEATGALVLEKNLPVASGIGGGSADAAATLRLLARFWSVPAGRWDAGELARKLGADVPVCLANRPALMSGIGEILVPAPALPDLGIVLINPGVAVATPSVFRTRRGPYSKPVCFKTEARSANTLSTLIDSTANDLEAPARALAPVIGDVLDAIAALPDCLMARMSGSGATCFGLFETPDLASIAAKRVFRGDWWVWGGGLASPDALKTEY